MGFHIHHTHKLKRKILNEIKHLKHALQELTLKVSLIVIIKAMIKVKLGVGLGFLERTCSRREIGHSTCTITVCPLFIPVKVGISSQAWPRCKGMT